MFVGTRSVPKNYDAEGQYMDPSGLLATSLLRFMTFRVICTLDDFSEGILSR
jgi:hypothetical protein